MAINCSRLNPSSTGGKASFLFECYPDRGEKFSFAFEKDFANFQVMEKKQSCSWKSLNMLMHSADICCFTPNPLRFLSSEHASYLLLFSRFP